MRYVQNKRAHKYAFLGIQWLWPANPWTQPMRCKQCTKSSSRPDAHIYAKDASLRPIETQSRWQRRARHHVNDVVVTLTTCKRGHEQNK